MKPQITVETWTAKAAKAEMEEQERRIAKGEYRNRTVSQITVNRYANDMKQGHWLVNNQGLGWDANGNLVDGRHRLWACAKSGVSVDFLCFRGLAAQKNDDGLIVNPVDTIDVGRVRTIGNQFAIDGVKNSQVTASAIRAIAFAASYPSNIKIGTVPARAILKLYQSSLDTFISMIVNTKVRSAFLAPLVMYGLVKPRKAEQFYRDYTTLVGLKEGSPAIALDAYARSHSGRGGTDEMKLSLCATSLALYHYDQDNSVNMIRHTTIGIEWLQKLCKEQIKEVINFIGLDAPENL